MPRIRLDIWHNILWSKYKGVVFSELYKQAVERNVDVFVFQIAESEANRAGLAPIDMAYHKYPHELIFSRAYDDVPRVRLLREIFTRTWRTRADFVVLAGYHRVEYWLQAIVLKLRRKHFATFCDATIFDQPQTLLKSFLKTIFFAMCSGVFCYGDRSGEYVHSFGVPWNRIWKRCQAAALPYSYDKQVAATERKRMAPKTNMPHYLFVGRLSPEKNIDVLLKAFAKVRERYREATLSIVGKGPQEAQLIALAESLDITESVVFLGGRYDDDLYVEYYRATCLVLPSSSEPWGLVVNEALSYGCPVLVSNRCGCVPELVVDGRTGYVVNCGDIQDHVQKMIDITAFSNDVEETTRNCLSQIAPYSSDRAATQILEGCLALFAGAAQTGAHVASPEKTGGLN